MHLSPARRPARQRGTCRGSGTSQISLSPPNRPTDATRRGLFVCASLNRVTSTRALPHPNPAVPSRTASRNAAAAQSPPRGCRSLRYWATTTRPRVRPSHVRRSGTRPRVRSGWLRPWMLRACSSSAPARQWTTAPRRSRPTRARAFSLAVSTRPVVIIRDQPRCEDGAYGAHYVINLSMLDRPRRASDKHTWPAGPRSPAPGVAC
jgi:hypothetical protein